MQRKRIAIIGAGPGGLAAAMLLSHRGFDVQVFEKQAQIGGRSAQVTLDSTYHFDLGPTFLMMKFVLDELFQNAGRSMSDYLDCRPLDPMYTLNFQSGSLRMYADPERTHDAIEAAFPGEGSGFRRFLQVERSRFQKLYPCLQQEYGGLRSFVRPALMQAMPHVAAGQSLMDVLRSYFRSEPLRLAFTFQSKYLGMSPWDCPGLFAMIPYTEHAHGVFHVMGGLHRIPAAMAAVARSDGARIHTTCPVKQVVVRQRKSTGVRLTSGETLDFDEVVINADFGHAMRTLFPRENLGKYAPETLKQRPYSCSTFMLYLGVDRSFPNEEDHQIVFAKEYARSLEEITKHKIVSDDLSVYIRNSAPLDPSVAPPGHAALYILVPCPNNTSGIDWEEHKYAYRERILDLLAERTGYGDLRPHIVAEKILTPHDWESQHDVFLGATFNMGHSWSQMLHNRPHNRFELFDNTYLVGGGTHPGSGLPTIFESARISAKLICKKYRVPFPQPQPLEALLGDQR